MRTQLLPFLLIGLTGLTTTARAQADEEKVVNYETVSDEPYSLHKLYLHVQPMMADVSPTNVMIGFGVQADAWVTDKIRVMGAYRGAWGGRFDSNRLLAQQNAAIRWEEQRWASINTFRRGTYAEVGGTYHVLDSEKKGTAKVMLTRAKNKRQPYEIVERIAVNARIRQIIGARTALYHYGATTRLNPVIEKQQLDWVGQSKQGSYPVAPDLNNSFYTGFTSTGFAVGGSYGVIRNVAVKAEKYGVVGNNIMFNAYADVLLAPWTRLDDFLVRNPGTEEVVVFSSESVAMRQVGWRVGFDIMYNQDKYFSFGGEFGDRPGIAGRGYYGLLKIGLPVFAFKFRHLRTANNTGAMN